MERRDILRWTGAVSALAVAGCVSTGDDDSAGPGDSSDDTPSDTPDGTPESDADTDTPGSETSDGTPTDDGPATPEQTPVEAVEMFFGAFGDGDVEGVRALLHEDSEMELTNEDIAGGESRGFSVMRTLVVEDGAGTAVVEVLVGSDQSEMDRAATALRMELRLVDGAWKVFSWGPAVEEIAPRAQFETSTTDGTLEITHDGGDNIPATELYLRGEGLKATGSWQELGGTSEDGTVTAGDTLSVGLADEYSVALLWDDGEVAVTLFGASGASESATPEGGDGCPDEDLPTTEAPDDVEAFLADARGYQGLVDWTGKESVTVEVGACEDGLSFYPAAVQVDPGTTVRWLWTGQGGAHNVVAESGDFESEIIAEKGETFERTFEESGTSLYYCAPHRALGMKGAVVVTE